MIIVCAKEFWKDFIDFLNLVFYKLMAKKSHFYTSHRELNWKYEVDYTCVEAGIQQKSEFSFLPETL